MPPDSGRFCVSRSVEKTRGPEIGELSREEAIAAAEAQARERAIVAGAESGTLQTVDVEDIPLAYLPGNALRVRVRAAGEMASATDGRSAATPA